jgi:hypothetical protein
MRFLRQLLLRCANWFRRSGGRGAASRRSPTVIVPYTLAPADRVSRFIYSRSKIRKTALRPKPSAFDPSPYMELSTVHISGLSSDSVWAIGKQTLGNQPGRDKIHARADIPVESLIDVKLRALRDDRPFERHTSVIDWPIGSDGNEAKALWLEICLKLSEDARINLALPAEPIVGS